MTFVNSLKAAGDYVFPFIVGLTTMWGFWSSCRLWNGSACWNRCSWRGKAVIEVKKRVE